MSCRINNEIYLSPREASEKSGYTSDYISMLCRRGKVVAVRDSKNNWLVEESSLNAFVSNVQKEDEARRAALRKERIVEYKNSARSVVSNYTARTYTVMAARVFAAVLGLTVFLAGIGVAAQGAPLFAFKENMAAASVAFTELLTGTVRTTTASSDTSFTWKDFLNNVVISLFDSSTPQSAVVATKSVSQTVRVATTTTKIIERIVQPTQTTIVRNVTEQVTVTGITRAELMDQLSIAENRIRNDLLKIIPFSGNPPASVVNTQTFATSQRIDVLDGVTIRNATIIGGSISGTSGIGGSGSGSGTVDSGTTGYAAFYNSTGTSVSATSTLFFSSSQFLGVGTTSPIAQLTVYGDTLFSGSNRYLNFGDVSGALGYGVRDNGGVLEFKNLSGSWTAFGTGTGQVRSDGAR
jgi:hypothetical protein